jgi:hypothetical protein
MNTVRDVPDRTWATFGFGPKDHFITRSARLLSRSREDVERMTMEELITAWIDGSGLWPRLRPGLCVDDVKTLDGN